MTPSRKSQSSHRNNAKTLLTTLKLTTTIGAVSLTLAGWALLSQVEAVGAASVAQTASVGFANDALSTTSLASTFASTTTGAQSDAVRSVAPSPTAATAEAAVVTPPTATPTVAATAEPKVKLNIVQWVKTNAGDPVAVVRDNRGVLWYVWGTDVPRIEQGLSPQYPPQPVNRVSRTRRS